MTERLLAIRLHALGDVVITLPFLNDVKRRHPELEIDLLTRDEYAAIPRALRLFDRVHGIGGGRGFKQQCLYTTALVPSLLGRRYDLVVDLQNNEISRTLTHLLPGRTAARFDTRAHRPAGERTRDVLERAGLGPVGLDTDLAFLGRDRSLPLLEQMGHSRERRLVVLNPAGAFASRNWPLESYVGFAEAFRKLDAMPVDFVVLGVDALKPKAKKLREALGDALLDLVGHTSPAEAFDVVRHADLVLSEDSGLMHMAWVSGVPTLALFGSSRGDWSRPLGPRSLCLDSRDLDCGYCMAEACLFGDNRCLTRHEPAKIAELAFGLLEART